MAGPWEKYQSAAATEGPWAKYAAPAASAPAPEPLTASPAEGQSFASNAAAGAGKALTDAARGVVLRSSQALANAPVTLPLLNVLNKGLEFAGMPPARQVEASKQDIAESRERDAPLMGTAGGVAGNFAGNALLMAPMGAANTPAAAGLVGGLYGLSQPALSAGESALNTLMGGVGGAGGQWLANKLPAWLGNRVATAKAAQVGNAQKFEAARAAAKEGYVIPPADLEPGMLSEALSGFSGKIKTAQVASQRNQGVTDTLARKAIGLQQGDELTGEVLQTIRRNAAAAGYEPIKRVGTVTADKQFFQALDNIAQTQQGAARSFPGLADNGVPDLVARLKQAAFDAGDAVDATKVLREAADKAYRQGDNALGKANKAAADAIENMLERHLQGAGQPDALKAFREARQLIAKTYTVQKGLNSETGSVAANKLAADLAKGKPLSGELRTIAEAASAFPKATQALKEAPKAVSPLDFAVAGGTAITSANPLPLALVGARPAVRNMLLSGPVQARALRQSTPVPLTQAAQAALENRLAQMLLAPVGVGAGVQVAQ